MRHQKKYETNLYVLIGLENDGWKMEKHIYEQNIEQPTKHFIIVLRIISLGFQRIFDNTANKLI